MANKVMLIFGSGGEVQLTGKGELENKLEAFSEVVNHELLLYNITPRKIAYAVQKGMSLDDIMHFLIANSENMPQQLVHILSAMKNNSNKFALKQEDDNFYIESSDTFLLERLAKETKLKDYTTESSQFRIKLNPSKIKDTIDILADSGYIVQNVAIYDSREMMQLSRASRIPLPILRQMSGFIENEGYIVTTSPILDKISEHAYLTIANFSEKYSIPQPFVKKIKDITIIPTNNGDYMLDSKDIVQKFEEETKEKIGLWMDYLPDSAKAILKIRYMSGKDYDVVRRLLEKQPKPKKNHEDALTVLDFLSVHNGLQKFERSANEDILNALRRELVDVREIFIIALLLKAGYLKPLEALTKVAELPPEIFKELPYFKIIRYASTDYVYSDTEIQPLVKKLNEEGERIYRLYKEWIPRYYKQYEPTLYARFVKHDPRLLPTDIYHPGRHLPFDKNITLGKAYLLLYNIASYLEAEEKYLRDLEQKIFPYAMDHKVDVLKLAEVRNRKFIPLSQILSEYPQIANLSKFLESADKVPFNITSIKINEQLHLLLDTETKRTLAKLNDVELYR